MYYAIRESQKSLEEQRRLEAEIGEEVRSSKARVAEINRELEAIMIELGDAKVDKHEDSRRRKKAEIVENFKRLFPGVVSPYFFTLYNFKINGYEALRRLCYC